MAQDRSATTVWKGDFKSGKGALTLDSSRVAGTLEVTTPSRFEAPEGRTSPEELLAAAHSSCYSMALSGALTRAGTPPEQLDVNAVCTVDKVAEGYAITQMALRVRATVPGISAEDFDKAAQGAKDGCPVSKALAGNLEITLDAALA